MKKKLIIIPDSFKGSMSSERVSDILAEVIREKNEYETVKIPIADGGEGSTDCILKSLGGEKVFAKVKSPEGKAIDAFFGITSDNTGVVEIAESSGLTKQTSFDAGGATTYGFGQLIQAALDRGVRRFFLCLGGSATTDCACGMAAALGVRFYDKSSKAFVPTGDTLIEVERVDMSGIDKRIAESSFTVMSDVDNPLLGPNGAAYIYAPQKGADEKKVATLDEGLRSVSAKMQEAGLISCEGIKGAGAAGGAGYGCVAFLNAKIKSGIHGMLDICNFDSLVEGAAGIVTGEGKLDSQSLMGKVLNGIYDRAKGLPITAFCGICKLSEEELLEKGITAVEIGRGIPVEESMQRGEELLREKASIYYGEGKNHE